jgi:hypothetical protein
MGEDKSPENAGRPPSLTGNIGSALLKYLGERALMFDGMESSLPLDSHLNALKRVGGEISLEKGGIVSFLAKVCILPSLPVVSRSKALKRLGGVESRKNCGVPFSLIADTRSK